MPPLSSQVSLKEDDDFPDPVLSLEDLYLLHWGDARARSNVASNSLSAGSDDFVCGGGVEGVGDGSVGAEAVGGGSMRRVHFGTESRIYIYDGVASVVVGTVLVAQERAVGDAVFRSVNGMTIADIPSLIHDLEHLEQSSDLSGEAALSVHEVQTDSASVFSLCGSQDLVHLDHSSVLHEVVPAVNHLAQVPDGPPAAPVTSCGELDDLLRIIELEGNAKRAYRRKLLGVKWRQRRQRKRQQKHLRVNEEDWGDWGASQIAASGRSSEEEERITAHVYTSMIRRFQQQCRSGLMGGMSSDSEISEFVDAAESEPDEDMALALQESLATANQDEVYQACLASLEAQGGRYAHILEEAQAKFFSLGPIQRASNPPEALHVRSVEPSGWCYYLLSCLTLKILLYPSFSCVLVCWRT